MTRCLDDNQIAEFVEGCLSPAAARECVAHLDQCAACRELLASFAAVKATPATVASSDVETLLEHPKPAALPEVGRVLGERFLLRRVLGAGAMGVVYEARDQVLGLDLAVKVLRPGVAERGDVHSHLRSEILLGRRISHTNACRIYDLGSDGGLHFITLELVEGESLQAILERGPIAPEWIVPVLLQLCAALGAAHQVGIVHRDLKPANIMLEESGRAVVMDFGLAADVATKEARGGAVGTPAFWSPEQARGAPATAASDVWAIGAIAYLLLTGRRYSTGASFDDVPARLRPFVRSCLEVDPSRRPATAREAYRQLSGAEPIPHRSRRVLALAVLVALLTFVLVYLLGRWLQWSPTAALAAPQSPTSRAESG